MEEKLEELLELTEYSHKSLFIQLFLNYKISFKSIIHKKIV